MSLTVLATNDDGIDAPGLRVLVHHLGAMPGAKVYVVAPDDEWSARGHAITIREPLYAKKRDLFGACAWEISGSPADCVKLGLNYLVDGPVNAVVSGINSGPNLATDVLYSGTVAAAIEAVMAGIPSLAVSLGAFSGRTSDYRTAARLARILVEAQGERQLSPHLLNVNVPLNPRGIEFTELGPCPYDDRVETGRDSAGRRCYWLKAKPAGEAAPEGTDLAAFAADRISITPLEFFDITDERLLRQMRPTAAQLADRLARCDHS
ncbi:MAG: 5'/3'-nucleotidase SurE [Bacillota bacterium]